MDDEEIIRLFVERREEGISELSKKYEGLGKTISENILGNAQDAEECISDALLAVWNNIPPERPVSLKAYFAKIVRNISTKRYHYNSAEKRNSHYDVALDELEECFASPENLESDYIRNEMIRILNRYLKELDAESRMIFVRRYYYSDSVESIAERMGMSAGNVSVKLHRMRKTIKSRMESEGY